MWHTWDRGGEARHDVWLVLFRVVLQSTGATPLYIASGNGHVECVRALFDGGAAINQARVGCAITIAWHDIAGAVCAGLVGSLRASKSKCTLN